jgi:hypothetical protein
VIAADRPPALSLAALDAYDPRPAGAGAERRYCCPLEGCRGKPVDRQHQSLCVNVDSGLWVCNRCTARGKLTERWTQERRSVQQIRRARARARFALTPERPPGTAASAPLLPGLLERCRPLPGTPGQRYLVDRGIGLGVAVPARVAFCPDVYGRPAVVFPLHGRAGVVVAVNARHTDGRDDPKTHSVGDRSLGVFATANALAAALPLAVVEGPMDALSLAACGVPAVAIVCTRAPHWLRTAAAFRRVLVGLDADTEGDKAAAVLRDELAPFAASVERLRPPVGKDWNDALLADYVGLCAWLRAAGLPGV